MIVLGVTGGIATGKSAVSEMLVEGGGVLFNADRAVHSLMERDQKVIAALESAFPEACEPEGINRRKLGEIVFADEKRLVGLEALLHPFVRRAEEQAIERAQQAGERLVVMDIPLLFETGADALCDATIVTLCNEAEQKRRAMLRPAMTEEKLASILRRQMAQSEREARADYVVRTDGDLAATRKQVSELLEKEGL